MENIALSVVIISFNEEERILRCLESLPEGVEVIVLDSHSKDKTAAIAKEWGAQVYTRVFDNYADQKNAAIAYASRPWILSLDADEVLEDTLKEEILSILSSASPKAAYRLPRSLVYMGKKLRFSKGRDYPIRLFQKDKANFVGEIHERLDVKGEVGRLRGELLHFSYKNLDEYFERFNTYTRKIAEQHFKNGKRVFIATHFFRPFFEFFYRYIFLLGVLDGLAGLSYCMLSSFYTFVKYEKLRELQLLEKRDR